MIMSRIIEFVPLIFLCLIPSLNSGSPLVNSQSASIDFSNAVISEDGTKECVNKSQLVDTIENERVNKCTHTFKEQCHYSYITEYHPSKEQVCKENFEKKCQVTFKKVATNETYKDCYKPLERLCDGDPMSKEKCVDWPETVCSTKYVPKPNSTGSEKIAETNCKNVPVRICIPDNCRMAPSQETVCHDKVTASILEVPEEICDLVPYRSCREKTRLVPNLKAVPVCTRVPRQNCIVDQSKKKLVKKQLVSIWCRNVENLEEVTTTPTTTEDEDYYDYYVEYDTDLETTTAGIAKKFLNSPSEINEPTDAIADEIPEATTITLEVPEFSITEIEIPVVTDDSDSVIKEKTTTVTTTTPPTAQISSKIQPTTTAATTTKQKTAKVTTTKPTAKAAAKTTNTTKQTTLPTTTKTTTATITYKTTTTAKSTTAATTTNQATKQTTLPTTTKTTITTITTTTTKSTTTPKFTTATAEPALPTYLTQTTSTVFPTTAQPLPTYHSKPSINHELLPPYASSLPEVPVEEPLHVYNSDPNPIVTQEASNGFKPNPNPITSQESLTGHLPNQHSPSQLDAGIPTTYIPYPPNLPSYLTSPPSPPFIGLETDLDPHEIPQDGGPFSTSIFASTPDEAPVIHNVNSPFLGSELSYYPNVETAKPLNAFAHQNTVPVINRPFPPSGIQSAYGTYKHYLTTTRSQYSGPNFGIHQIPHEQPIGPHPSNSYNQQFEAFRGPVHATKPWQSQTHKRPGAAG